jgi:hypothetical protein
MRYWNSTVSAVLERCSQRTVPLTRNSDCDADMLTLLRKNSPDELFPDSRNKEPAYSALLLMLGDWEGSHELTNDDESPEGCYLHAIIHRMEPNPANSAYWWRHLGAHPLFQQVRERAEEILSKRRLDGWELKQSWDPFTFNKWCEEARQLAGSEQEATAVAIQRAELDLLFEWCAEPPTGNSDAAG